jgi:hypothetical protein
VFNDRYDLVTAGHVIDGKQIDALRFLDPVMLNKLAFKGFYPPKSEDERDDLAIFEIDNSQLDMDGFRRLGFLLLNRQENRQLIDLPRSAHLFVKGYPRERPSRRH